MQAVLGALLVLRADSVKQEALEVLDLMALAAAALEETTEAV